MKSFAVQRRARERRSGFILVVVLSLLVLLTALTIGFLTHASSQTKSAMSYRTWP